MHPLSGGAAAPPQGVRRSQRRGVRRPAPRASGRSSGSARTARTRPALLDHLRDARPRATTSCCSGPSATPRRSSACRSSPTARCSCRRPKRIRAIDLDVARGVLPAAGRLPVPDTGGGGAGVDTRRPRPAAVGDRSASASSPPVGGSRRAVARRPRHSRATTCSISGASIATRAATRCSSTSRSTRPAHDAPTLVLAGPAKMQIPGAPADPRARLRVRRRARGAARARARARRAVTVREPEHRAARRRGITACRRS